MRIKQLRNLFLSLAILAVVSLTSYKMGERKAVGGVGISGSGAPVDLSLMNKVNADLKTMFLDKDKMDQKAMEYGSIQGMVSALGDPYTVFLPPKENKSDNEELAGEFGGVGISLGYKDKTLAVMSPLNNTPASRAGIQAGDLILRITDKSNNIDKDTTGITLDEAVNLIRGKIGSQVTLKLYREGKGSFDTTLTRENIVVPSVTLTWKEKDGKKIAWVQLSKFTENLYDEWPKIVNQIKSEKGNNYGGIVLDLRNNPGGYLQTSVMVASDFVKDGVIVSQQSSDGKVEKYTVDPTRRQLLNDKLVVMINGGSASAAEILAGALKSYKRGALVGEKSFGKGTVQQPIDFPDGSGLHVTIAKWLLPDGKNIHKVGVDPDVEVKYEAPSPTPTPSGKAQPTPTPVKATDLPDNQLDKAVEVLLGK